jgi:hypothetical protein
MQLPAVTGLELQVRKKGFTGTYRVVREAPLTGVLHVLSA